MSSAILVAGVGNIFLGDDGFGVEVTRSLSKRNLPKIVSVKDFGIRGFDLAYALLDPWDAVIIVDALPRGEAPGTLFIVEPNLSSLRNNLSPEVAINPHSMDPVRVLNLAASMGTISPQVLVVGCEPSDFGVELEGRMGLSPPVQGSVEEACTMIEELVGRLLAERKVRPVQLQTVER